MVKARLGRQWGKLSQTGISEILKDEWEYAIKPQYRTKGGRDEYIVAIPAEAFKGASMNDDSRVPIIKEGRIYFKRCVVLIELGRFGSSCSLTGFLVRISRRFSPRCFQGLKSFLTTRSSRQRKPRRG